jgi:hypothetical protein
VTTGAGILNFYLFFSAWSEFVLVIALLWGLVLAVVIQAGKEEDQLFFSPFPPCNMRNMKLTHQIQTATCIARSAPVTICIVFFFILAPDSDLKIELGGRIPHT